VIGKSHICNARLGFSLLYLKSFVVEPGSKDGQGRWVMSASFGGRGTSRRSFRSQRIRRQYDGYLQLDLLVQALWAYNELQETFTASDDVLESCSVR